MTRRLVLAVACLPAMWIIADGIRASGLSTLQIAAGLGVALIAVSLLVIFATSGEAAGRQDWWL